MLKRTNFLIRAGACLILAIVLCQLTSSASAKPAPASKTGAVDSFNGASRDSIDRYDDNYYSGYYAEPLTRNRLGRLRRGYYYVDDGYISRVPTSAVVPLSAFTANRRQDLSAFGSNDVRFTPLVKYKQTRTKRKKLFVPNFFG